MVNHVREAETALGFESYELTKKQIDGRDFSRSLYIVKDVKVGQKITEENIRSIRPGFGLHPKYLTDIIGKKFNKDISRGTRLSLNHIEI